MPKEVRYLLFSNEELYQALINDLRVRACPMPKGYLKKINLSRDDKFDVTLVYATDQGSDLAVRFEEADVLRALIAYCCSRHIPMAAKATKSVEVKDGLVGLLCTLNFNRDHIAVSGDKVSYQDGDTVRAKEAARKATAPAARGVTTAR